MHQILLLDDECNSINSAKRLLEDPLDSKIIGFDNPYDALKALENDSFDGVFTDLKMPFAIDGIVLLEILKILCPKIPKIIISGFVDVEPFASKLQRIDYDEKITKPLPMAQSRNRKYLNKIKNVKNILFENGSNHFSIETDKFRYIARANGAIVGANYTLKGLTDQLIKLQLKENIKIEDNHRFEDKLNEKPLMLRRPLRFTEELI